MSVNNLLERLTHELPTALGEPVTITRFESAGGGCINSALRLYLSTGTTLFVKWNPDAPSDIFECEAEALRIMQQATSLKVPTPIIVGNATPHTPSFLVLEDLTASNSRSRRDPNIKFDEELAKGLAEMHCYCGPAFGFSRDNFIGATPQPNAWSDSWLEFFRHQRLEHMVKLLSEKGKITGATANLAARFLEKLDRFLGGIATKPVLLHGDLWGGNVMPDANGRPALIDPACYYGHHEADLAMTQLFGGFSARFYEVYAEILPLADGYRERFQIYNLYHILNHAYLFGGGYLNQAVSIMARFV